MPAPVVAAPAQVRRSSKALPITLALVLVAGAGITAAAVLSRGGGDAPAGVASREELVNQTLAAINGGNVETLLTLSGPEDMQSRFSDCTPAAGSADDPKQAREALRRSYQKLLDDAKGLTTELVKITGDSTETVERGKQVGRCTMTAAISMVEVKARVKVGTTAKSAKEQATKMQFVEIDGNWFLASPPAIKLAPDCATAVAKAKFAAASEAAMVQRCTEDRWPDEVIDCVAKGKTESQATACTGKLPSALRDKLAKDLTAMSTPAPAPATAAPPNEPEPERPATSDELPAICTAYGEQIGKLETCRNLSAQHKQIDDSFATLKQGWAEVPVKSAAMRASFEKICTGGIESVVELRKQCR